MVAPVPNEYGLHGLVRFRREMHFSNSKNFVEVHIIEPAPVHCIGEEINQIRVLIFGIKRKDVVQSLCSFFVSDHVIFPFSFV